jgi:N-acetylglucosaminyldiphosphoundecaprenol N-acetyl-beta-D-mannosaminyltransferase
MDAGKCPVKPNRINVLGVPVDAVNMQSAINHVESMLAGEKTHLIFAVNPEKVIAAQENPDLLRALEGASLLIPDGIGVVLAARLQGTASIGRVPGSDLMPEICALAARQKRSVFLYGAKPGVAAQAASLLQSRYPGLRIAGTEHGYIPAEHMEVTVEKINASGADVLFVGLGSPAQELWLHRRQHQLRARACQGVGGTFDAICGNPKRAPQILQSMHLEWLHRLILQPRRANRQSALPRFAAQLIRSILR